MNPPSHRLSTLDALRGIAALSVCWFHFTNGNPDFLPDGLLKSSGAYAWLGVQVFFVISGFIIPYALQRSGYVVSSYGTFLVKRMVRLDPPYLAAICAVIVLGCLSNVTPGFKGPHFDFSLAQVLLHLGYVNVFFGYPWLAPVFWTLAIELQYYLLAGLLFPAVASSSVKVRSAAFIGLATLALLIPADQFVFHWLFLFMLGMAAFQFRAGIVEARQFAVWIALFGLGAWYVNGPIIAVIGVATTLLLGWVETGARNPLLLVGQISYPLYLLHVPIGGRVINLSLRFVHTMPGKVAVIAAALAASSMAALLLHKYVERPAQQWSSGIRYRGKSREGEGLVTVAT